MKCFLINSEDEGSEEEAGEDDDSGDESDDDDEEDSEVVVDGEDDYDNVDEYDDDEDEDEEGEEDDEEEYEEDQEEEEKPQLQPSLFTNFKPKQQGGEPEKPKGNLFSNLIQNNLLLTKIQPFDTFVLNSSLVTLKAVDENSMKSVANVSY